MDGRFRIAVILRLDSADSFFGRLPDKGSLFFDYLSKIPRSSDWSVWGSKTLV